MHNIYHTHTQEYSPNGRFLVQETFPKTLPRFVLILISLQRWQHRVRIETKHFVSPHLIGPQFLANQHETNQHESTALIGLFHATSSVLLSMESYRNYRKPTQRGVQGYLSSLQRRVKQERNYKILVFFKALYLYISLHGIPVSVLEVPHTTLLLGSPFFLFVHHYYMLLNSLTTLTMVPNLNKN